MANQAAESAWDNNGATAGTEENLGGSFEMVPRDPSETENPHEPAMQTSTNSWADESNDAAAALSSTQTSTPQPNSNSAWAEPAEGAAATPADDGFHEVERRGRGGHRGDGQQRGRGRGRGGRGGEHRGRGGFRGERRGGGEGGRGRGRGAPQGAPQGAPRS